MIPKNFLRTALLICVLIVSFTTTAFASSVNQSPSSITNNNNTSHNINQIVIADSVPQNNRQNQSNQSPLSKLNDTAVQNNSIEIQDETMLIIPIMTMLEDGGGSLLFTALLVGVGIGVVGTVLVQRVRRGTRK